MFHLSIVAMLFGALSLLAPDAHAFPSLQDDVTARYPNATELESCGTCHTSFTGSGGAALNPYGNALAVALGGGAANIDAAMAAVEDDDSDGDTTSNVDEMTTGSGVHPGWTCETYVSALNPPSNLADIVDPIDPGCNGVTTTTLAPTTTLGPTTTTLGSTTTTTTLPGGPQCSEPLSSQPNSVVGSLPVASDCLFILQVAVGSQTCTPACICAPTGTLPAKATDALLCLNVAVGVDLPLDCPCGGTTTTTLGATTTTLAPTTTTLGPTTTTLGPTTTTTLAPPTTTTTTSSTTTTIIMM